MKPAPTATVIIPTYRRTDMLRSTLRSLARSRGSDALDEVIVVENGERVGSDRVCDEFGESLPIRYLFVETASQPAAFNHGLRSTHSDLIISFDDDVEVGEKTVEAYLEAARAYGRGHFFGGRVDPIYEGAPPPEWMVGQLDYSVGGFDLGPEVTTSKEFLQANWAAFRSDLLEEGGYPDRPEPSKRVRLLGGETDLQAALRAKGLTGMYLPDAVIGHHVSPGQCTMPWARRRRYAQHLTWTLLNAKSVPAPRLAGAPRYLWRQCAEQALRVLAARTTHPRTKRYMQEEMRLAELWGQLNAYRLMSGGFRIEGAVTPEARANGSS